MKQECILWNLPRFFYCQWLHSRYVQKLHTCMWPPWLAHIIILARIFYLNYLSMNSHESIITSGIPRRPFFYTYHPWFHDDEIHRYILSVRYIECRSVYSKLLRNTLARAYKFHSEHLRDWYTQASPSTPPHPLRQDRYIEYFISGSFHSLNFKRSHSPAFPSSTCLTYSSQREFSFLCPPPLAPLSSFFPFVFPSTHISLKQLHSFFFTRQEHVALAAYSPPLHFFSQRYFA